jgi:hypothetical protein
MLKALFYKEWIKTRWYLLLAFIAIIGVTLYCLLFINRSITMKGIEHLWEVVITRDAIFVQWMQYVPVITALLLALVQFVPEMYHKSLKLTLHLPFPTTKVIFSMLIWGFLFLLCAYTLSAVMIYFTLSSSFAIEITRHILYTTLPWYTAGIAIYFLFSAICLEPTWKFRILYVIIGLFIMRLFFLSSQPEAYNRFLSLLMVYSLLLSSLVSLSVARFKQGCQDK